MLYQISIKIDRSLDPWGLHLVSPVISCTQQAIPPSAPGWPSQHSSLCWPCPRPPPLCCGVMSWSPECPHSVHMRRLTQSLEWHLGPGRHPVSVLQWSRAMSRWLLPGCPCSLPLPRGPSESRCGWLIQRAVGAVLATASPVVFRTMRCPRSAQVCLAARAAVKL